MVTRPKYTKEEFARRGDEIYDQHLCHTLEPEKNGQYGVIDIDTGQHDVDEDEIAASDRLLARLPGAQAWVRRVGSRTARRFGPRT
jgi:hypothetical protein